MLKYSFIFLIAVHGLIHIMGYFKAFDPAKVPQLIQGISKPVGILWLAVAILFLATALLFMLNVDWWWALGIVSIVLSQAVIISNWTDAKFGTIPNLIILVVIILSMGSYFFESGYIQDVKSNLNTNNSQSTDLLTTEDLNNLPKSVQKYIIFTGSVGKPKLKNVNIVFKGQMRGKGQEYFSFKSEQYNFFDSPTRLFYMKAKMFGLTVPGYHKYMETKATMDIKPFGLISVVKISGKEMNQAETVTLFNDMCLMAPATLIDKRIQWKEIDSKSTKATFTNNGITISATLYFDDRGRLNNFVSDDRIEVNENKQYRFSTPVSNYREFNGYILPAYGETIWHYTDGEFVYGKFNLEEINYNVEKYSKN